MGGRRFSGSFSWSAAAERLVNAIPVVINSGPTGSKLAEYGRCQSDVHQVQISLPAAKIMTHPTTPRKIQTAKSTCFLNSFSPALNRAGRPKKIDRTNKMIGIAAAKKAMIFKSMIYPFVQARMIEESGEKGASGVEREQFLGQ